MEIFHSKNWVEEKGNEVVIGDISVSNENKFTKNSVGNNNIDYIFKEETINDKWNWDFDRFLYGRDKQI